MHFCGKRFYERVDYSYIFCMRIFFLKKKDISNIVLTWKECSTTSAETNEEEEARRVIKMQANKKKSRCPIFSKYNNSTC